MTLAARFISERVRRFLLCLCVVSAALSTRHAFAEADNLKWDLTYQTALDDHPIDGSEWMASWPKWFAKRALTDELAAYSGEQIDASLLIETPNPHAGDPDAIWFFKTKTSAHTCSFSVRVMSPCKQVDPARTEIFIREVMNYKQVQFTPVKEKWNGMLMNYFGFLSAYVDGRTLQRPIATIELFESLAKQSTEAADVARLTRAVEEQMRAALAEEDQAMVEEAPVGSISFERIVSALILFAFDSTVGSEARKLILGIHPYSRLLPLAQLS